MNLELNGPSTHLLELDSLKKKYTSLYMVSMENGND